MVWLSLLLWLAVALLVSCNDNMVQCTAVAVWLLGLMVEVVVMVVFALLVDNNSV